MVFLTLFPWYKPIQAILSDLHLQLQVLQDLNTDMFPEIASFFLAYAVFCAEFLLAIGDLD